MKEPKRIKFSPETPNLKEPPKHRLAPLDMSGQDNDDMYVASDLDEINKLLDKINREDNS